MNADTVRAYQLFVGVDIAAATFTAAWQGLETTTRIAAQHPPSGPHVQRCGWVRLDARIVRRMCARTRLHLRIMRRMCARTGLHVLRIACIQRLAQL